MAGKERGDDSIFVRDKGGRMTGEKKIRPCRASGRLAGLGDGRGKDEQRQRE